MLMATNAAVADMSSSYAPCVLGAWFCGTAFSFIFSMVVRALSDTSSYTSALTSFTVIVVATAAIAGVLTETPSDTSKPRRAITSIIIGTLVASAACHISVTFLLPTIAVGVPEVGLFVQCCLVSFGGILSWVSILCGIFSNCLAVRHYNDGSSSKPRFDGGGSLHNEDGPSCSFV